MGHRLPAVVVSGGGDGGSGGTATIPPYPGRGSNYPQSSLNSVINTIIDRKAERDELSNLVRVHEQLTPAATWTIPNTPNARAVVLAVYDTAGRSGYADVYVTDANTSIVFSSPRTGRVDYLRS